jgi:hypothetical protein
MAVTPISGLASVVTVGGTPVIAVGANLNGGVITNPYTATDQGIGTAEPLYVNPVGAASTSGNGSTFALQPGQSWTIISGQTTPTSVNAATSGHKFSCISY